VVDPHTVNDLHATILHLLGLEHTQCTYFHNGRMCRLTDVAGEVIRQNPTIGCSKRMIVLL
jgi:hypothetical protein